MANVPYSPVPDTSPDPRLPGDPFLRVQATPASFGGAVAQGMEGLGAGIEKAQSFYGQMAAEQGTNQFQDFQTKLLYGDPSKMITQPDGTQVPDTGFYGKNGQDALSAYPGFMQQLQQQRSQLMASMPTGEAKLRFDEQTNRMLSYEQQKASLHMEQQYKNYYTNTNTATINAASTAVQADPFDNAKFDASTHDAIGGVVKNGQLGGYEPGSEVTKNNVRAASQNLWNTRLTAAVAKDPAATLKIIEDNKQQLGPLYDQWHDQVQKKVESLQGKADGNTIFDGTAPTSDQVQKRADAHANTPLSSSTTDSNTPTFAAVPGGTNGVAPVGPARSDGVVPPPDNAAAAGIAPIGPTPGGGPSASVPQTPEQVAGQGVSDAAAMITHFEGFRTNAYWDVNHWRVGYGSDTITRADGSIEPVTSMTTVNRADADRDLQRRVQQTQGQIVSTVGQAAWEKLSPQAKASVTSTVYNYGKVPVGLAGAIEEGDPQMVTRAIQSLGADNNGVNARRREQEAANVAGRFGISGPETGSAGSAPTYTMPKSMIGEYRAPLQIDQMQPSAQQPMLGQQPTGNQTPPQPSPAMSEAASSSRESTSEIPPASLEDRRSQAVEQIMSSNRSDDWKSSALATVDSRYNRAKEANAGITNDITNVQKQIIAGIDVPQAQWDSIGARVRANASANVRYAYDTANAIRDQFASFKGRTPDQIQPVIDAQAQKIQAQGGTQRSLAILGAAQDYQARLRQDVANDPLGRGSMDGIVTGVTPLKFGDVQQFETGLQARVSQAEHVAQVYNRPVQYTLPSEKAAFQAAAQGPAAGQLAAAIINTMGPNSAVLFKELGESAPAFAHIGLLTLAGADPGTTNDLSEYNKIAQDKPLLKQIQIKPEVVQTAGRDAYGSALLGMPQFRANAIDAGEHLAEVRAFKKGSAPPVNSNDMVVDRAFQEAAGATYYNSIQYGGVGSYSTPAKYWGSNSSKVLYPPGVKVGSLNDVVNAVTDQDLAANPPVAGDLKTVLPMARIARGNLVAVGMGRYVVALGAADSDDPQWVMGKDGQRFTLDLAGMTPALRQRVPEAYNPRWSGVQP